MRRLSRAESTSMRRNSVRSIADLLLQLRPSMSAPSRAPWRLSHRSQRRSTEASAEPVIAAEGPSWSQESHISNVHKANVPWVCWHRHMCMLNGVHTFPVLTFKMDVCYIDNKLVGKKKLPSSFSKTQFLWSNTEKQAAREQAWRGGRVVPFPCFRG